MPYVNIKLAGKTEAEQKNELMRKVTDALVDVLQKSPSSVYITIDELQTDNWGIGGKSLTDIRKEREQA